MGNLFNALNGLKTNIFGGPGNTGSTTPIARKSAIELADSSPTSKLNNDPFAFSSLSYPLDVSNDMANGHYMLFYINVQNKTKFKYTGSDGVSGVGDVYEYEANVSGASYGGSEAGDKALDSGSNFTPKKVILTSTGANAADIAYAKGGISKGRKGTINTSDGADLRKGRISGFQNNLAATYKTTTRVTDSVALYLPPNVQDSTSATYNGFATGVVGLAAAGGANFLQAMRDEDFERASKSFVNVGKGLTMEAIKKSSAALVESLTDSEGSIELVNSAFGQATNPYMEVLFDQMALRGFTYNFTFAPRNKAETDQVQRIIQLFRFHMAPELKGANNRFLTLPSTFDIHYMYQMEDGVASENDFYNRIATCVLESCTVDYTPDGVKSFASGAPTQIKMSLTFKETELLTKDRINEGF
tara:strand:- start:461 stop:1708 length:1248 start_codon:yes stop_codon:yes gene_type:complete